jgi:hypothetical protein
VGGFWLTLLTFIHPATTNRLKEFIEFTIAKEIIINVAMAITPLIKQIIFINNWLLCSSF